MITVVLLASSYAFADYTVSGKFTYQDREFDAQGFTGTVTPQPIRFATVRIMTGESNLAQGQTREDGSFSIGVSSSVPQLIYAICISSSTTNVLLSVRTAANGTIDLNGDLYAVSSRSMSTTGKDPVDFGNTVVDGVDSDANKAFNIWDAVVDSLQLVASPDAAGSYPTQKLTVSWSSDQSSSGSFFGFDGINRAIYVGVTDCFDDTVIAHEVGHYIDNVYMHSDSPGGAHYLGDDTQDIRLSWSEGLATYLGCTSRKFKGRPKPEIYVATDGKNLNFSYELEHLSGEANIISRTGSTNETAVSAVLWDITDSDADYDPGFGDHDPLSRPFGEVWRILHQYLPAVSRPGISIETFWIGWLATYKPSPADLQALQNTFAGLFNGVDTGTNGIEFYPDAQEPDDTSSQAPMVILPQRPALASGPKVLISEIDPGSTDSVELYNAGDSEADLSGWTMEASAPVASSTIFTLPAFKLAPGAFVLLSEGTGANSNTALYFNRNISWANGGDGACSLKDSTGAGVDFVRWGYSNATPPSGTLFNGPNPESPPAGKHLARNFTETDTDTGSDWSAQTSTLGTYNSSGQERHHTYYSTDDVDYVAFSAAAGRRYLAETLTLFDGADTVLEVLGTDGAAVLANNDDFGKTKASRLVWTAPADGKYYLRSRRFSGASNLAQFGSYDLRIIESSLPFTLALPQTLTVSQPGLGGRFQRLSDAIAAASSGDQIQIIDNGTYAESTSVYGVGLTITAAAGKNPVIDGRNSTYAALNILGAKEIRIDGLTILGARLGINVNNALLTLTNSVISGAQLYGIQAYGAGSSLSIVNCTIVKNGSIGVAVFNPATARVSNSIVQDNSRVDIGGDNGAAAVNNSLIGTGGFPGNGNITGDPQFVNASQSDIAQNDYRLKSTSPAIDKGNAADPDLPDTDADGLPRKIDGTGTGTAIPDMGAYEYMPPGTLTVSAVFPQIAAGGTPSYRTSIVAINTGSVEALANLSLTKSDGAPFPITVLGDPGIRSLARQPPVEKILSSGRTGDSFNFAISPGGIARYEASSSGGLVAGYAKLASSIPLSGAALFKTMAGEVIQSEAGVGLSRPATSFLIYIDNSNYGNSGYAIANTGGLPANLTLTLRDNRGQPKATADIRLEPGTHLAEFAFQRFAQIAGEGFEGSIEFGSDQPVEAVALRYDNPAQDVFSTIPVLSEIPVRSTTLYFPQVADGGTYRTNFILVNPSSAATTAHVEFFKDDGSALGLTIGGALRTSIDVPLDARGVAHLLTDGTPASVNVGWVRVTSPVALGGSAIFQTIGGGQISSEAGVPSAPAAAHFTTYVSSMGYTESGLALSNPNSTAVSVTLRLRDATGQVQESVSIPLDPLAHIARFFTQWFSTGFSDFEGTLELLSTGPVCAVALRYDNSQQNVFATLPVSVIP